jgi:hypothetical protein
MQPATDLKRMRELQIRPWTAHRDEESKLNVAGDSVDSVY